MVTFVLPHEHGGDEKKAPEDEEGDRKDEEKAEADTVTRNESNDEGEEDGFFGAIVAATNAMVSFLMPPNTEDEQDKEEEGNSNSSARGDQNDEENANSSVALESSDSSLEEEDDDDELDGLFGSIASPSKRINPSDRTLFDEAREMLVESIMTYGAADIRAVAKKGGLVPSEEDPDALQRVMELPCSSHDILTVYRANEERMAQALNNDEETLDLYHTALTNDAYKKLGYRQEEMLRETVVVEFEDMFSDQECVYSIVISHKKQRITVAFRGTVTTKDIMKDIKAIMIEVPNPVRANPVLHEARPQPRLVSLHAGFMEYLYGDIDMNPYANVLKENIRDVMTLGKEKKRPTKYKAILEKVAALCSQNLGYELYVTGHSMGGALATLLAFEAAASTDERIPKPVTLVSIAAPRVGNLSFRRAVETLEEQRMLRCLRVSNELDVVTMVPSHGVCCILDAFFYRRAIFRHAGMHLALKDRRCCKCWPNYRIDHPPKKYGLLGAAFGWLRLLLHDVWNAISFTFFMSAVFLGCFCCGYSGKEAARQHSCGEYRERLLENREELESMYLNEVYNQKFSRGLYPKSPKWTKGRFQYWIDNKRAALREAAVFRRAYRES